MKRVAIFLLASALPLGAETLSPEEQDILKDCVAAADPDAPGTLQVEACRPLHDRCGRRAFLDGVLGLAKGADAGLAIKAVHVLAAQGDRRAAGAALRLLKEPGGDRLGEVLVQFRSKDAAGAIAAQLDDGNPRNDRRAVGWLDKLGDRAAVPALLDALKHPDADVRKCVPGALAALGAKESVAAIQPLLQDPDVWVRKYAAEALGELGAREAAAGIERLLEDPEPWVRYGAIVALARLGAEGAMPRLRRNLAELDAPLTARAIAAIGELPGDEAVTLLAEGLKGSPWKREYAGALVSRRDEFARTIVSEYLAKMEPEARIPAAAWLAMSGDERGRHVLLEALGDRTQPGIPRLAAYCAAYSQIGGTGDALLKLFADSPGDAEARIAAAWALGQTMVPQPSEVLAGLLEGEKDPTVRMFVLATWARSRGEKGAATLRDLAGTRWNPVAVGLAVEGQMVSHDEESNRFLIESLDDERTGGLRFDGERPFDFDIRVSAILALQAVNLKSFGSFDDPEDQADRWRKWWDERD